MRRKVKKTWAVEWVFGLVMGIIFLTKDHPRHCKKIEKRGLFITYPF
jgi:hypothetical protein